MTTPDAPRRCSKNTNSEHKPADIIAFQLATHEANTPLVISKAKNFPRFLNLLNTRFWRELFAVKTYCSDGQATSICPSFRKTTGTKRRTELPQQNRFKKTNTHWAMRRLVSRWQPFSTNFPKWGLYTPGHGVTLSIPLQSYPVRKVNSKPLHLFSMNWADSGPGFSWPEVYYVKRLPYNDRFVVTVSADSKDFCGFEDLPLGSFKGGPKKGVDLQEIRVSTLNYWIEHYNSGYEAWEELSRVGAIKNTTPYAWRSRVWQKSDAVSEEW